MARYRVKDWSIHFEKNRTRELKRMEWVAVPNRMDGRGYTALVDHPNGAAHLGAWVAILQIASRSQVRGEIPQDGAGNTETCLARISRLPVTIFFEVLPRLVDIGWVECYQQYGVFPQDGAGIPQLPAESAHYKTGNGITGQNTTQIHACDFEARFYEAWDRHKKHRGGVTVQMVQQRLLDVDWDNWNSRHIPYCSFWDSAGWTTCTLSMLEWWENGMPLPPPPANGTKHVNQKQDEIEKLFREARS